jgi:TonB family protein
MRYLLAFLILFFAACNEPATEDVMPEAAAESAPSAETPDAAEPEYTESDVPPVLVNRDEVRDLLQRQYPASLKADGVGGRVVLWMRVDEIGTVAEARVQESSGYEALDEAAQFVAAGMQFSPAENKGEPVSVWIAQPIDFRPGG